MHMNTSRWRTAVLVGTTVIGVATALITAPHRRLSLAYVACAALLGAVTGLLTHRLSPNWRAFIASMAVVVVLEEVAEHYYSADFARAAPVWSAGVAQAIIVGCATYSLALMLALLVLDRRTQRQLELPTARDVRPGT